MFKNLIIIVFKSKNFDKPLSKHAAIEITESDVRKKCCDISE